MAFKYKRKPVRKVRKARKSTKPAKLAPAMKRAIRRVVRGEAETKHASFYQSANNGSSSAPATGLFSDRGWALQNNTIANNNTDILQLIPYVPEGTSDWERIGKNIRPVSLKVQGSIRCVTSRVVTPSTAMNLDVYMYVLQHVQLKDYVNLRAQNDFTTMLDTNEGGTSRFLGNAQDPFMSVSGQYYKVLLRRKIELHFGGAILPGGTLTTPVSIANAHQWYANYSLDLTKHIPKKLMYPDSVVTTAQQDIPTNSSIFMSMGFVDNLVGDPSAGLVLPWLEQTYVSTLSYKDS